MPLPPGPTICLPAAPVLAPDGCPNCGGGGVGTACCVVSDAECLTAIANGAGYSIGDEISFYAAADPTNVTGTPYFLAYRNKSDGTFPIPFYLQSAGVDIIGAQPPLTDFGPCDLPCDPAPVFTVVEHQELISGIGNLALGGAGAGVLSVSILVRNVGAPGSVTITTVDGPLVALDNETYGWAVIREQDTELDAITIDTTDAADAVLVLWSVAV